VAVPEELCHHSAHGIPRYDDATQSKDVHKSSHIVGDRLQSQPLSWKTATVTA
jgi:hypothetical protein